MTRPIVGIPAASTSQGAPNYWQRQAYCRAVLQVGGAAMLIPPLPDEDVLRALYAQLDGLLLAGGGDVAPELYGASNTGLSQGIDPDRDATELLLTRWAYANGLPMLGICRGIQTLNVALGGDLIQDLPSQFTSDINHATNSSLPLDHRAHEVRVAQGSLLEHILELDGAGRPTIAVNSRHHQAVEKVAPGLRASAWATDGLIEAIELESHEDGAFCLGLQWHPENLLPDDRATKQLFSRFIHATKASQRNRS